MNEATVNIVNAYWATTFGCDVADLRPSFGAARPHAGFGDYEGVYAMVFGNAAPIASVPRDLAPQVQHLAQQWRSESIRNPSEIASVLGARAGLVLGPAQVAYADAQTLRARVDGVGGRKLRRDDERDVHAFQQLRDECSPDDWEAGGSNLADEPVYGVFAGESLAAIAGYEVWGQRIAHIAVLTHSAHRGNHYGQTAVLAAAHDALAHGLVPQYRTLESNVPSCRMATALGFVPFATSLAVRVRVASA